MRSYLHTNLNNVQASIGLLWLRILVASFMLTHGAPKLMRLLSSEEIQFMNFMGMGPTVSFGLAVFAEFFCSVLLMLGLFTRLATIPLIVTMSTAAFVAHAADPFGTKERALLYLVVFVMLLITGGGRYSLDQIIFNKKN